MDARGDPTGPAEPQGGPIVTVNRSRRNLELLGEVLHREGFPTRPATTLDELDELIDHAERDEIRLVLLDVSGFDRAVWDRCERLRALAIPFLVLSPRQSAAIRLQGLERGARAVLAKPLLIRELLALVRNEA